MFAAIAVLLSPIGMPALTAPFVLITWLSLLPKSGFRALRPVALADVGAAENTRASYRVRESGPDAAPALPLALTVERDLQERRSAQRFPAFS